jgi:hypothetical protein
MSVRVMSAVWAMDLPAKDKLVLLALADCANDEGIAWPSIATLARKCGCDERTIQRNLRGSELAGIIRREEVPGRGNRYHFNPRQIATPGKSSPVTKTTKTPGKLPPKPSRTVTKDLADAKSKRARSSFPCPDGCDPTDWDSLLATRKAQRRPMTAGAYKQITNKLRRWADAGWPPGPILANAAERGWLTVFETDEMKRHDRKPPDNDEHRNPYVQAALERQAERAAAFGR